MVYICIKKQNGERLGSQILSIKNALYVALHLNANIKIGVNHSYTDKSVVPYIPNRIILCDSSCNTNLYSDDFCGQERTCKDLNLSLTVFRKNHLRVLQELRKHIKLPVPEVIGAWNDLYIHIRSGDTFNDLNFTWGKFYIPPPLIFYYNAIRERAWRNIYLICEDRKNDCVNFLIRRFPRIKWKKQSLVEDIKLILGARNIVYGGGTFVPSLLEFNNSVQLIYRVDYGQNPIKPHILYRLYDTKAYIKALGGEFSCKPIQRYYMIHFGFKKLKNLKYK